MVLVQRKPARRRRRPARDGSLDTLSARLGPELRRHIDRHAIRAKVNRSELARWGWDYLDRLISRRGYRWLKNQIDERRVQGKAAAVGESSFLQDLDRILGEGGEDL